MAGGSANGWKWWVSSIGVPLLVWIGSLIWMLSSFNSFTKQTTQALEGIRLDIQGVKAEVSQLTKAVNGLETADRVTSERLGQLGREHNIKWDR